jgi:hypothetical protein
MYSPLSAELRRLLKKENVPDDQIAECPPLKPEDCPCPSLIHNVKLLYHLMPTERSEEVLTLIYELFGSAPVIQDTFQPKYYATQNFFCPELGIQMYQPCSVTSCQFHTPNDWVKNCAIVYFTKHGKGTLSYNELTFILNMPLSALRPRLNASLKKLRSGALKNDIQREGSNGLFSRVFHERVCPVCENFVPRGSATKVVKKKITYCSQACFDFKPPAILAVESEFSMVIERLLTFCASNFATVNLMSNALGLSRQLFTAYCKRYRIPLPEQEDRS